MPDFSAFVLGRVHGVERLGGRAQRVLRREPGDRRIVAEFRLDLPREARRAGRTSP